MTFITNSFAHKMLCTRQIKLSLWLLNYIIL